MRSPSCSRAVILGLFLVGGMQFLAGGMQGVAAQANAGAQPPDPSAASATLELAPLFGDGMVLQRDRTVALFGHARSGIEVSVRASWSSTERRATAGADGRFRVEVATPGAGGPHRIEVRSGDQVVTLSDVWTGDVWLCSGQSNMEMPIDNVSGGYRGVRNYRAEIAAADHPRIRLLTIPNVAAAAPRTSFDGQWQVCRPDTARRFSATGYFFGRAIQRRLDVPIGLIAADWGGTVIEAWISKEGLTEFAEFRSTLDALNNGLSADEFAKAMAAWLTAAAKRDDGMPRFTLPEFIDEDWPTVQVPGALTGVVPDSNRGRGSEASVNLATFDGFIWLRRKLELPESFVGRDLVLRLGPIDDQDQTYWNGRLIGQTLGAGKHGRARSYRVRASDQRKVCLAVRVHDTGGAGGLMARPQAMVVHPVGAPKEAVSLAGKWRVRVGPSQAKLPPQPNPPRWGRNSPTAHYNGMIAPLRGLGLRGVIWYQGESNRTRAAQYRRLLTAWMSDWRKTFDQPELPFYMVQIAPFAYGGDQGQAAALRQAQWDAAEADPNCALAITTDIGNPIDIHPNNKQAVGDRLARCALAGTYGLKDVVARGPVFAGMTVEGNTAEVRFTSVIDGLVAGPPRVCASSKQRPKTQITHFEIAGADRKFYPATAILQGDAVLVSAKQVSDPVAVRFAQGAADEPNLFHGGGLPAVPFRTDKW